MFLHNLLHQDSRKQAINEQESSPAHENQISFTPPSGIAPVSLPAGQSSLQRMLDPKAEERQPIQHKLEEKEKTLQKKETESKSGMPDSLKTGIENLSGTSMDNVQVHYNSSQPAHWQASAIAQGNNIHLGPGQEKHLPHEAWHVAQQRQGKVKPTMQMKEGAVNDDPALEKEADIMGQKSASSFVQAPQTELKNSSKEHTVTQKKEDFDIEEAVNWYKTRGKGVVYSDQLAENLYKVAGLSYKSLYESVLTEKALNENFVRLVGAAQKVLKVTRDGKYGSKSAAALSAFQTGGDHGIDYGRLFKDKKLEIGVAVGDEFDWEALQMISYLSKSGFTEKSKSDIKNEYTSKRSYKTPGDNTAGNVEIEVNVTLTWAAKTNAKNTYADFLANKEVSIYSGHARYGTGPDFDAKDDTSGNFVIGKGYDSHMNNIIKGNKNDLKDMSSSGKFDMNSYQLWFFNACSSNQYKDEIRGGHVTDKSGKKKSTADLRFMGTKHSIVSDALPILQGVVEMKTMEEIIKIMNVYEIKNSGEKVKGGYYSAD